MNHLITPSLALIDHWWDEAKQNAKYDEPIGPLVATRAAQWGADQELEACCEWLRSKDILEPAIDALRAARRPKPPSLKQQALKARENVRRFSGDSANWEILDRAIEALPEPAGVTDEELCKVLYQAICEFPPTNPDAVDLNADQYELELEIRKARAVLARYSRPTIQTVPVGERPWERTGWCDEQGRCWLRRKHEEDGVTWKLMAPASVFDDAMPIYYAEALPANALPAPASALEVEE